jgi:Short C-terminal domain
MGLIRKALFVATAGLSGRVFKDNSRKERAATADAKRVRPRKQTKVTRPKPQARRRPKPRAARTSTVAQTVASGDGTTNELERLADLHVRGALTDEEFAAAKAKILGTSVTPDGSDRGPATFQAVEANVAAARHLADSAVHDRGASGATVSSD